MPAKISVVSLVAFQCRETSHGMFDHPAELAGADQPGDRRFGQRYAP